MSDTYSQNKDVLSYAPNHHPVVPSDFPVCFYLSILEFEIKISIPQGGCWGGGGWGGGQPEYTI